MEFCSKLTARERAAGRLSGDMKYTLPTEAQWEYACRAGTSGMSWAGDFDILGANNAPALGQIAWYGDYPSGSMTDPEGPSMGSLRVLRGGSWDFLARGCRSANRSWLTPPFRGINIGFRLSLQTGD